MGKAGFNRRGKQIYTAKDMCRLNEKWVGNITDQQLRKKNKPQPGPRMIAIEEYVRYKKSDIEKTTHEEKLEHVIKYFEELRNKEGYTEAYVKNAIENAPKWIDDFVKGVTNKNGQLIKDGRSKKGDGDAR